MEGRAAPPAEEIAETLEFPEPVGNELTLGARSDALIDRLLARGARRDALRAISPSPRDLSEAGRGGAR